MESNTYFSKDTQVTNNQIIWDVNKNHNEVSSLG